jgi:hypothetical protein
MRASLALPLIIITAVAFAEERPDPKKLLAIETTLLGRNDTFDRRIEAAKIACGLADPQWTKDRSERVEFAKKGVEHGRKAIEKEPKRVEGHYFFAIAMGRKLDSERLPSPSDVKEMLHEAIEAAQCDGGYDFGGPHRFLGIFYSQAPGPPASYGDWDESVEHFEAAIKAAPTWPENHVRFAEELARHKEWARARAEALKTVGLCRPDPKRPADPSDLDQWDREARELLQKIKDKK